MFKKYLVRLMSYIIKRYDLKDVTDGYHSFRELYIFKRLYNAAFFNLLAQQSNVIVYKSLRHSDGELCLGTDAYQFIVVAHLMGGQISNHYHICKWDDFKIPERDKALPYDGHTPQDVIKRLENYIHNQGLGW